MVSFFGLGLLGISLLALLSPTVAGSLNSFDDSSLPDERPVDAPVNMKLPPGFPADVPASTTFTLPPTAEAILPAGASGDSGASATLSWEPAVRTEPGNRRISPYVKDIPGSPVTTGTPEICTPMTCTQSYFNQEVVSTDKCNFIYESTSWRCSKSTAYTSKCLDYAKPLTDCLYYGTEVPVGSWVEPGPFAVFGGSGKTLYDTVTPRVTLHCVSPSPNASPTCTSWCSYSTKLPPNDISICSEDKKLGCFRTTSTCVESLPACLYKMYDSAGRIMCVPPTMPVGGCSTATYYSPSAVHSGITDYLTTSICSYPGQSMPSCFIYNLIGTLGCIPFSKATEVPSTVVSTTVPATTASSSTSITKALSCAYGTTTFPFTWKICSGLSCATSSSVATQCKEIVTSKTHSESWSPPSSSSSSSQAPSISTDPTRTQSATVTPTFRPDNQKFQIFLDEPTKGFLSRLAATYCQGQWCENALIHSEIMTHLHLNGFTADRIRGWNLDNTNEHVLEDNNATEWWATNAMADYVAQEYTHNRPLSDTIIIDEMLQGLESEKLAEYNEDESPTTSTATVPEAPTLTPACQLSSGEPMASADVMALASALEWRFGQMVMKPKPTLSCVNFVVDVARLGCLCNMSTTTGTFSHSTRTYTTTEGGSASVTTDVCGGYTTWPKISTRSLTPNPTISPIPIETMRCETAEVGWLSPSYDKCANAFCSAAVIGQWYARDPEMHGKLRWRCPIPGTETYPRNRGLVFLIHFEDKACPPGRPHDVEFENQETTDYDISDETCMETFTRLKSCKFAMKKDGKYYFTGGGVYSECLWWRAYWPGREHDTPGLEKLAGEMDEFQMNLTRHADEEYWRLTDAEQHWANGTARLASDGSINLMNGTRGNATSTDLVTFTKASAENDLNERV
ncbi:hypothetical protein CKM354_000978500 [Cercospora kikuchii]|uniref:Uncharacterized protein n=1 Tax=Cercospora kikuchii TaxID=84275 RepID=A0A9P3FJD0_9PEZI|nr:uncharacterized protein CKM354_000978500 [Cercospora kikuchii]GIZ46667.1 hypothetical protein CKM354_000978500 [Cercospora kikuchii]